MQFTFVKYLSKSIIVCGGQLLCSIIYQAPLLIQGKLLPWTRPRVKQSTSESICNRYGIVSLYYAAWAKSGAAVSCRRHGSPPILYLFPYVWSQMELPATRHRCHFVIGFLFTAYWNTRASGANLAGRFEPVKGDVFGEI